MKPGDRFYYTGDAANHEGEGTITAIEATKWGINVRLEFDDRRALAVVSPAAFAPGPGRRFWPMAEWEADRAAKIATFHKAYPPVVSSSDTLRTSHDSPKEI